MNITDRIPPQDLATERSVLGTFIITPSAISDYTEILPNSAFYMTANRKIWETLKYMVENDIPIDLLSLSNELLKKDQLEECGGSVYLAELSENIVTTFNLPHHIKTLIEKDILRDIISENSNNSELCFNENISIKELLFRRETFQAATEKKCDNADINRRKIGKVSRFSEYREQIHNYKKKGFQNVGVCPGKLWPKFTLHYRPAKGMLNVFTGIPSHGKSEFVDALMMNLSSELDWKWAIYSPENWPVELHAQKLMEKFIGYGFFDFTEDLFENTLSFIDNHFKIIEPDEDNITVDSILKLFRESIQKDCVDGCIIDPWNELDNTPDKNESLTAFIGRKLGKIRRFARNNSVFMGIVAHPAKMYREKGSKKYNVPRLYDISDSAHWYNKSDNGLTIYRNAGSNIVDVHIQKIKFKVHGQIGCVSFTYDKVSGRYTEYDETVFTHETDGTYQETMWQNK